MVMGALCDLLYSFQFKFGVTECQGKCCQSAGDNVAILSDEKHAIAIDCGRDQQQSFRRKLLFPSISDALSTLKRPLLRKKKDRTRAT